MDRYELRKDRYRFSGYRVDKLQVQDTGWIHTGSVGTGWIYTGLGYRVDTYRSRIQGG